MVPVDVVRPSFARILDQRKPEWRCTGLICQADLAAARRSYVEELLTKERGELTRLDEDVLRSLERHQTLSSDVDAAYAQASTFGERLADVVSSFGGSWTFIVAFMAVIAAWIAVNTISLVFADQFDPYPYILLNLVLSCLAALQAPIIMMSQRRLEAKDRLRAENDYRVNLKAELEIRHLHEKLDHLLIKQWERLTEIQQIQLELMEDLNRGRRR